MTKGAAAEQPTTQLWGRIRVCVSITLILNFYFVLNVSLRAKESFHSESDRRSFPLLRPKFKQYNT